MRHGYGKDVGMACKKWLESRGIVTMSFSEVVRSRAERGLEDRKRSENRKRNKNNTDHIDKIAEEIERESEQ